MTFFVFGLSDYNFLIPYPLTHFNHSDIFHSIIVRRQTETFHQLNCLLFLLLQKSERKKRQNLIAKVIYLIRTASAILCNLCVAA